MSYHSARTGCCGHAAKPCTRVQGMDVFNERKVFELLSSAAGQPGTPQCFLLTPKLLPALPFSQDCTVLQVWAYQTGNVLFSCSSVASLAPVPSSAAWPFLSLA